jgi:hypothetical protein
MRILPFLILSILFFAACEKDEENSVSCEEVTPLDSNQMNLNDLRVGQKFRYLLFLISIPGTPFDFSYTGDTLELEVVEVNGGSYLISEKITAFSNIMDGDQDYFSRADSVYHNYWSIEDSTLTISHPSGWIKSHFVFRSQFSLEEFQGEEVEMVGWKTSHIYNSGVFDVELFTTNYSAFGNTYDRLNIYINDSPMAYDANGNTTVYSMEYGFVRTTTYNFESSEGHGWHKL